MTLPLVDPFTESLQTIHEDAELVIDNPRHEQDLDISKHADDGKDSADEVGEDNAEGRKDTEKVKWDICTGFQIATRRFSVCVFLYTSLCFWWFLLMLFSCF